MTVEQLISILENVMKEHGNIAAKITAPGNEEEHLNRVSVEYTYGTNGSNKELLFSFQGKPKQ